MKLGGGRKASPGDSVPEAAGWRSLRSYITAGHIGYVSDAEEAEVSAAIKAGRPVKLGALPLTSAKHAHFATARARGAKQSSQSANKPTASSAKSEGVIAKAKAAVAAAANKPRKRASAKAKAAKAAKAAEG